MPEALQTGTRGESVRRLQVLLLLHGLLKAAEVDGIFGPRTEAAVRAFQVRRGLTADGVVTAAVWDVIGADLALPTLHLGMTGPTVEQMQRALNAVNDNVRLGSEPLVTDGVFGPRTVAAMERFQRWGQVPVDGICGPRTWSVVIPCAGETFAGLTVALGEVVLSLDEPAPLGYDRTDVRIAGVEPA